MNRISAEPNQRPNRVGVIDIGSNTVLLLVADVDGAPVDEASRITRIGKGVFESGRLDAKRARLTRDSVIEFAERARQQSASPVVAVATEALRRAEGGREFLAELQQDAGLVRAWLLSGEEEARYTIEASRRAYAHETDLVVVDIGGGSTELAWRDGDRVRGISLPLGSVRLSESEVRDDPPSGADLARLAAACDRILTAAGFEAIRGSGTAVALAGTATTLAALDQELLEYRDERVEGYPVTRSRLNHWLQRLARLPLAQRKCLPGMEPGRADVILAGLVIMERVWELLGVPAFRISGRGVRHGVALSLLPEGTARC